jgi:capsular exopolysaccharide synthesis family protein
MTALNNDNQDFELEDASVDLKKIIGIFMDYWFWFALAILLFGGAGYLYLRWATPMYKVDATLLVEDPQKGSNGMFSEVSNSLESFSSLFDVKSSVDNEAQILQTTDLMIRVAEDLKLYSAYYSKGRFHDLELYGNSPFSAEVLSSLDAIQGTTLNLVSIKGDVVHIREKAKRYDVSYDVTFGTPFPCLAGTVKLTRTGTPFKPGDSYYVSFASVRAVAEGLHKAVSVNIPNKQVTTIGLEIKTPLAQKGEDILNTMIRDYIHENIETKNAFADSTIDFIDDRIVVVDKELEGLEKGVESFKRENHLADIDEQSKQIIDNSADYVKELNQVEVQEQITDGMLKYLQDDKTNKRPVPSLLTNPDPTFLVLLDKYNTLLMQRDRLAMGSTDENPLLQNTDEQIANVRKDLVTNLQNQLLGIRLSKQRLQSQNNQINEFINTAPAKERQFLDLSRKQDLKQALFVFLLQKKEEVAVTKASNIASARLIDSPKGDSSPYSPKSSLIMLGALLAGVVLTYLAILLKNILNYKVTDPADLKNLTQVPALGEIMHNKGGSSLVFAEKSRSVIAEQFRVLRTNLQFTVGETPCPVILFTSSMSGEGKSFVATNLGLAYASVGKKVLLAELDLRKPKLSANLKQENVRGFSNYIISSMGVDDIISVTDIDQNVHIIPSGPIPPNPAELLSSPKVKQLMTELKKRYDIIIIDAPPIGLVTDAQLLAPYADTCIYLVRQNYTLKQQLNIVNHLKTSDKMRNLYLVLNDVKVKASSRYGYGKDNGYGYGYGYGYGEDMGKRKKPFWKSK